MTNSHVDLVAPSDEVIATLAHDLRTPLTTIAGYAGLISKVRAGDEELAHLTAAIERNVAEMLQMVDRLRTLPAVSLPG